MKSNYTTILYVGPKQALDCSKYQIQEYFKIIVTRDGTIPSPKRRYVELGAACTRVCVWGGGGGRKFSWYVGSALASDVYKKKTGMQKIFEISAYHHSVHLLYKRL